MTFSNHSWPDEVQEILDGDQVVLLAYVTPAHGVVLLPLTNFALNDRAAGTVTVTTSLGAWRKLERISQNPHVALAFHTRTHGFSDRPEYVLIQGHASFPRQADRAWLESIEDNWVRYAGPRRFGALWDRWLDVYHWERVGIEVAVDRVVVWPDLGCTGEPAVYGTPLQDVPPAPQRPPRGGTGPRIAHRRAARAATRLPDVLLGWVDADGFPAVAPVSIAGAGPDGIELTAPPGIPPGGRRAGLTAHAFTRYVRGQIQRVHTGWLEAGDRLVYAPHTQAAYRLPESLLLYRLVVGGFTRLRQRQARRAGFLPER